MKKAVSLILALTLALALSVPAFAAVTAAEHPDYTEYLIFSKEPIGWYSVGQNGTIASGNYFVVPDGTTFTMKPDYAFGGSYGYLEDPQDLDSMAGDSCWAFATIEKKVSEYSEYYLYGGYVYPRSLYSDPQPEWTEEEDDFWAEHYDEEGAIAKVSILSEGLAKAVNATPVAATPTTDVPAQTTTPATTTETPATTEKPATTAPATTTPAGSGSYTAQKYDTYGQLAVNYYGSYAYTKALQKANNYKALKAGAAVTLPDTLGKAVRLAPAVAGTGEKLYTVVAGDTLGTIAKAYYGNSAQYKAIFERNADRLKNANTIYEGQIIVLPAK